MRKQEPKLYRSIFHADPAEASHKDVPPAIFTHVEMPVPTMDELDDVPPVLKEAPRKARWAELLQTFECVCGTNGNYCC